MTVGELIEKLNNLGDDILKWPVRYNNVCRTCEEDVDDIVIDEKNRTVWVWDYKDY